MSILGVSVLALVVLIGFFVMVHRKPTTGGGDAGWCCLAETGTCVSVQAFSDCRERGGYSFMDNQEICKVSCASQFPHAASSR